jgi:hypothetical protein
MSQRSDKNWIELLSRNEKLAIEVGRLRTDVRSLKQKISALLAWKLIEQRHTSSPPLKVDAYTQYDGNLFISESYLTPKTNKRREELDLSLENAFTDRNSTPTPNKDETPIATVLLTPAKISPSQVRIKELLSTRIKEDQQDSTRGHSRTPRSVKKPVTYKEPSLRVKVRKGFQFFTFSEQKIDADE